MITKDEAVLLWAHYDDMVKKLTAAMTALADGGVQSYSIDGRSLTRFDIGVLKAELADAVNKRAEYAALMQGKKARKAVGVIPRD